VRLEPGAVDVFITMPGELDDAVLLAEYDALLTDAERARKSRFVFERHRHENLVTRVLVRTTLSRYRPLAPAAWRFEHNEYGCPRLEPACGLEFNLSNHPSMVVCAVTEGAAVGIDVEPLERADEIVELAPQVFAPEERAALAALSPENRGDRAISLWTAKEAYIKARGMGVSLPLQDFAFRFDEPLSPSISFDATIDDDPERWWFRIFDVAEHRIALAVERTAGMEAPCVRVRTCVPLRADSI